MAQANLVQEGIDRFESAFKSVEKDFRRLQKRAEKRRKDFERQADRRLKRIRRELLKNPVLKRAEDLRVNAAERAEALRSDTVRTVEEQVDALLGTLRIASHGEVSRLERKVGALNRKVRQLEKLSEA